MIHPDNHVPSHTPCREFGDVDPLLTDVAFGVADAAAEQRVRHHVSACPSCAEELRARRDLLAHVVPDRNEPPAAFLDGFADRVMTRITGLDALPHPNLPNALDRKSRLRRRAPRFVAWSFRAAAAVVLIAAGIFLGRAGQPGVPSTEVAPGPPTGPDPTLASAMDVLDRSRTLLLDIMNSEQAPNMDIRQRAAGELAVQAASVQTRLGPGAQTSLNAAENARLAALLQELELVLLQMAHSDSASHPTDLAMIRDGVDRNGLLFKIELTAL